MSSYISRGSTIYVEDDADSIQYDTLPVGTYTVNYDEPYQRYYLSTSDDFTLPKKVYGDAPTMAGRVLNTFNSRDGATGVHLDGVKGSGKTLLAKNISIEGAKRGIPTIIINSNFSDVKFHQFIQRIDVPVIVVFDEFEKVFNYETQEKILTLLDGVFPTKKLFIITTNDQYAVSSYLKNRPGRIFYKLTYDVIEEAVVREYLGDNLNDKAQIDSIVKYSQVFTFFNFDMLAAIVEEMNRYKETLGDVLKVLNIQPEMKQHERYSVNVVNHKGDLVRTDTVDNYDPNKWGQWLDANDLNEEGTKQTTETKGVDMSPQPPSGSYVASVGNTTTIREDDDDFWVGPEHLINFDGIKGEFRYSTVYNRQDVEVVIIREKGDMQPGMAFNNKMF